MAQGCFDYTSALATSDALLERTPETAAAAVRAIAKTQAALKATRARDRRGRSVPADGGRLIAELIRRDLPYLRPSIPHDFVAGMNRFTRALGILSGRRSL